MTNTNDIPQSATKDIFLSGVTKEALSQTNLSVRIFQFKHQAQNMFVDFILNTDNSPDGFTADHTKLASEMMLNLIALEAASALFLAADHHHFEIAVEFASENVTATLNEEFEAQMEMEEADLPEFVKEYEGKEWFKSNTSYAEETSLANKAKAFASKTKRRKDKS